MAPVISTASGIPWRSEITWCFSLRVETTSGENSLVTHREVHPKSGLDDDKDSQLDVRSLFTEIVFPSKESAERARNLMKISILHCGGAVRSAEVAARLNAEKDAQQALFGRLQKQCYRLIQNNRKSPNSAKFDSDSPATIHKALDGNVLAFGTVDAETSFGGMLRKHYSCQFVLDNGSWLPKGEPLLF